MQLSSAELSIIAKLYRCYTGVHRIILQSLTRRRTLPYTSLAKAVLGNTIITDCAVLGAIVDTSFNDGPGSPGHYGPGTILRCCSFNYGPWAAPSGIRTDHAVQYDAVVDQAAIL